MECGGVSYHRGYKDHKCAWCGEIIVKGEKFAHCSGKWQGEWQNWRMHLNCEWAMTNSKDHDSSDGFELYEHKRGTDIHIHDETPKPKPEPSPASFTGTSRPSGYNYYSVWTTTSRNIISQAC